MFGLFKKKAESIGSPVDGVLVPLKDVQDPVFAQGMMGTGFAIKQTSNTIYSPIDGVVSVCFPTGHAIGLKSEKGLEILLHVGIDTVELNGEGFRVNCKQGDFVKAGDKLLEADIKKIESLGKDPICIVIFPNKEECNLDNINHVVQHGESILHI